MLARGQPWRIEHVRSGFRIGLESLEGIAQVLAPVQEVLRAGAEGERKGQAARRGHRGADAFHRQLQGIDGRIRTPAGIFDGAAHQSAGGGLQQGVRTA